ncbi:FAD binding domain-containing protein [Chloroflexota bacterium]
MWQTYETPTSVEETVEILAQYGGQAQIIAGGTDLMIELQEGKHSVECLVDVTRIPDLDRIEQNGDWIVLGPSVTFRQILESPLLQEQARVLTEAAASVGALQIQTMATLAGNVVSAMPAADGCVALLALDAEVEIADSVGRRWEPVGKLFLGPGQSDVDPRRQMLTAIRFPAAGMRQGSAWERIGRRRALVLPILNCAVSVALNGDGNQIQWAHIGLGPVAPVPFRARETEAFLASRRANEETFVQAGEIAASESSPRSSPLRASREYRTEVLKVLVRRGLERAVSQAQERVT